MRPKKPTILCLRVGDEIKDDRDELMSSEVPKGSTLATSRYGGWVEVFGPSPGTPHLLAWKAIVFDDSPYVTSGAAPPEEFTPLTELARELIALVQPLVRP